MGKLDNADYAYTSDRVRYEVCEGFWDDSEMAARRSMGAKLRLAAGLLL
jgi:hypothetical protein